MKLSLATSLAFAMAAIPASSYGQEEARPSSQIQTVVRAVEENFGAQAMLILDKDHAELLVVDHGRIVMQSPALYGKGKGEDEQTPNVTPSGIFGLKEYSANPREYRGGRVLGYLDLKNISLWIHPTWEGDPSQKRDERLASATPDDNAISEGCINVPYEFYQALSAWVKTHPQNLRGRENLSYAPLVILPKNADQAATYERLGLNSNPGPALNN